MPVAIIILFITSAILFMFMPELDLLFSSYFYNPVKGGFYLEHNHLVYFIDKAVPKIMRFVVVVLLALLVITYLAKSKFNILTSKNLLFIIICLLIGPGLVVNGIFKEHWGRARPSQIVEFGGTKQFTPAFVISNQCESNCSFTSGHASAGFFPLCFGMLATNRKRKIAGYVGGVILGAIVGMVRIVEGAHFMSDVIFSGFFVYFSALLVRVVMDKILTPR